MAMTEGAMCIVFCPLLCRSALYIFLDCISAEFSRQAWGVYRFRFSRFVFEPL